MTDNEKNLQESRALTKQFESSQDTDLLREAGSALENVNLVKEADPKARARLRAECLAQWLELVALLHRYIDPAFDPKDVPATKVDPPQIPGGPSLEAGTDPARIADPVARLKYERAIAANNDKAARYRAQTQLGRIAERVNPQAEIFIRRYYKTTEADRKELSGAVDRIIKDPARKTHLSGLLAQ